MIFEAVLIPISYVIHMFFAWNSDKPIYVYGGGACWNLTFIKSTKYSSKSSPKLNFSPKPLFIDPIMQFQNIYVLVHILLLGGLGYPVLLQGNHECNSSFMSNSVSCYNRRGLEFLMGKVQGWINAPNNLATSVRRLIRVHQCFQIHDEMYLAQISCSYVTVWIIDWNAE